MRKNRKPGKAYFKKQVIGVKKTMKEVAVTELTGELKTLINTKLRAWVSAVELNQETTAVELHGQIRRLYDRGLIPDWDAAGVRPSGFFGWPTRNQVSHPSPPHLSYSDVTMVEFRRLAKQLERSASLLGIATAEEPFHEQLAAARVLLVELEALCPRRCIKPQPSPRKSLMVYPGLNGEPSHLPGGPRKRS